MVSLSRLAMSVGTVVNSTNVPLLSGKETNQNPKAYFMKQIVLSSEYIVDAMCAVLDGYLGE